ncbi:MAG TPA: hypothetical protein VG326_04415 [Tepidisphaeraceae bacterium]|jgi:hypothetical protein|nr:hypothetical protein [Tepidisphaeraceae bacterium]
MKFHPPKPTHVPGTHKGEELVMKRGREPGRGEQGSKYYQSARDSTAINADGRKPIDPRMPNMPPA